MPLAESEHARAVPVGRFAAALGWIIGRLAVRAGRGRAAQPAGYVVINGCTFTVDLLLLTALHGGLHWPLAVAVTVSYVTAFALSFVLNRRFNFRSHGRLGRQIPVYVAVVTVNYLAWILGVTAGLAAIGVDYRLARIIAGLCEAVYMYASMRWLVFRDERDRPL